jgi:hypothetical protein
MDDAPTGREMLPSPAEIETISTEQQLELAVGEAENRFKFLQRVMKVALQRTYEQDWVVFDGKPYLTGTGAERIRPMFGITLTDLDSKRYEERDKDGPYYYFVVSGIAHFKGDAMAVVGTCSSRDQFFATRWEEDPKTHKRERQLIPSQDVDPTNIVKAAYTNLVTNAVTRILGIRGFSLDQLKEFGLDPAKIAKVKFTGRKPVPAAGDSASPSAAAPAAAPPADTSTTTTSSTTPTNGAPPDGTSWFTSLQQAVGQYVGAHFGSPQGLSLLQRVTAYKAFQGWRSWDALAKRENVEQICQISFKRLTEIIAKEGKPAAAAPPTDSSSTPPKASDGQSSPSSPPSGGAAPPAQTGLGVS